MKKVTTLILLSLLINTNILAQNNTTSVEEGGSGVMFDTNYVYCESVEEGGSGNKSVEEGGSGDKYPRLRIYLYNT